MKYHKFQKDIVFILFCIIVVEIVSLLCNYTNLFSFTWEMNIIDVCFIVFSLIFTFNLGTVYYHKYIKECEDE